MLGRTEQTFEQGLPDLWLENDGMIRRVEKLTDGVTQDMRDV